MTEDEEVLIERITVSRKIRDGKPRIAGTPITVVQVLDLLANGLTIEQVTGEDCFPMLTREDVLACLRYAEGIVSGEL